MDIQPGRYWAEVSVSGRIDTNCIIGYDEPMSTYFFQSGEEDDDGRPIIWLGTRFYEFASLKSLFDAMSAIGITVLDWELAG